MASLSGNQKVNLFQLNLRFGLGNTATPRNRQLVGVFVLIFCLVSQVASKFFFH